MCGITGWVAFDRDLTQERALIDAMTETMSCRGPDASGVWSDRNATLGHRRLDRFGKAFLQDADPQSAHTAVDPE